MSENRAAENEGVDVLAIGAHPDDVELRIGGTVHKLVSQGRSAAILDLTRGEGGTRGTPETRAREAAAGAAALGVARRLNLAIPDGQVADTRENRIALCEVLRQLRPTIVLCHYWKDLHADHAAAGALMRSCHYSAGFARLPARGEPHRPHAVLYYMSHEPFEPAFIVDTTGHFEAKRAAIACYGSQLHTAEEDVRPTRIGKPDLLKDIEARDRYFGTLIERTHGEPFALAQSLPMDDPVAHFLSFPMT